GPSVGRQVAQFRRPVIILFVQTKRGADAHLAPRRGNLASLVPQGPPSLAGADRTALVARRKASPAGRTAAAAGVGGGGRDGIHSAASARLASHRVSRRLMEAWTTGSSIRSGRQALGDTLDERDLPGAGLRHRSRRGSLFWCLSSRQVEI